MKLDPNEQYEIRAEAFRIMTGHMAPGKDASPHSYPAPYEERRDAYDAWTKAHGHAIRAVLIAVERVLPDVDA